MSVGARAIRAGRAFVEVFADTTKLTKGLNKARDQVRQFAQEMRGAGAAMAGAGAAMSAPLIGGVNEYAQFELILARMQSAASLSTEKIDEVRKAALAMSEATGQAPRKVADGMLELVKAGVPIERAMGDAGEAVLQLAKVGELTAQEAGIFASDVVNVFSKFGVNTRQAANVVSAAADSSSISIFNMVWTFNQSASVLQAANQDLMTLGTTAALLGKNGLKGSDAGTALKTMFTRLSAPIGEAADLMKQYDINVRDATGNILPMVDIIGILNDRLGNLDLATQDDILARMFGQDAIRPVRILMKSGVEGFKEMEAAIRGSMPVSQKYEIVMQSLAGQFERFTTTVRLVAYQVGAALAPALEKVMAFVTPLVQAFGRFVEQNPMLVLGFAAISASLVGVGTGLIAISLMLPAIIVGFKLLVLTVATLFTPVGLFAALIVALGVTVAHTMLKMSGALDALKTDWGKAFSAMADAIKAGNFELAFNILKTTLSLTWNRLILHITERWQGLMYHLSGALNVFFNRVGYVFRAIGNLIENFLKDPMDSKMWIKGQQEAEAYYDALLIQQRKANKQQRDYKVGLQQSKVDELEKELEALREEAKAANEETKQVKEEKDPFGPEREPPQPAAPTIPAAVTQGLETLVERFSRGTFDVRSIAGTISPREERSLRAQERTADATEEIADNLQAALSFSP